ncbi:hypothetical protein [Litchfieldia salsa]|uniref:Uncharacterized protein n=1 Tax=Litchfieldia salsa TaxID=930152 RepID=A0A1H0RGI8_9BACI|nr:hypothetical protein [Litchfieldia salsa]SDP28634.1 hypothetical protein SAMN05216565_102203 [Litchfieldia salsa]
MVAAILIPIIFIYFFIKSKKEANKYHREWITMTDIRIDSSVIGTVSQIFTQKERFYYNKFLFETTLIIQTTEGRTIKLKKIEPITPEFTPPLFLPGEQLAFYGFWDQDYFRFSLFENFNTQE